MNFRRNVLRMITTAARASIAEEMATLIRDEMTRWRGVIKRSNLKVD